MAELPSQGEFKVKWRKAARLNKKRQRIESYPAAHPDIASPLRGNLLESPENTPMALSLLRVHRRWRQIISEARAS
jgi:hypothetical protein